MRHPDEGTGQQLGRRPDDGHLDEGTIHAWLDGALDAAESAHVEQHAATCEACSAMVAEARGLVAAASRILTRLDDVPAGVVPAGAAAATAAAAPTPASAGPRLARKTTGPAAGRRRRWVPTVWTISAAAAAVLMAVLVTGDDVARLTDQTVTPAGTADSAPVSVVGESAPAAAAAPANAGATQPDPQPGRAGSRTEQASVARAESDAAAPPAPVATAQAFGGQARRAGGFVPRASDAPAPAQVMVPEDLRGRLAGAPERAEAAATDSLGDRVDAAGALVAGLKLAESPGWTDSLTRARLPRRIGIGSHVLIGARLVASEIDTLARPLERRSVYELEDGARVTLVEVASVLALEEVVTTAAPQAESLPPTAKAQLAEQESRQRRVAAAEARDAAPGAAAAAPPAAANEVLRADGSRVLEPAPGELVVVRPDGTVRLEWREAGADLSLEGRIPIERIRALKERVHP